MMSLFPSSSCYLFIYAVIPICYMILCPNLVWWCKNRSTVETLFELIIFDGEAPKLLQEAPRARRSPKLKIQVSLVSGGSRVATCSCRADMVVNAPLSPESTILKNHHEGGIIRLLSC
jgi:hypothetical protein